MKFAWYSNFDFRLGNLCEKLVIAIVVVTENSDKTFNYKIIGTRCISYKCFKASKCGAMLSTRAKYQCVSLLPTKAWYLTLRWYHNGPDGVSNHQPHHCLLNRLFRRRSKKTSKLRVNGLCVGNSPVTGEFPAQRAINAENGSISWRHHDVCANKQDHHCWSPVVVQ